MVFDQTFEEVKAFFYFNDFAGAISWLEKKSAQAIDQSDRYRYFAYQNKIGEFLFLQGKYKSAYLKSVHLLRELDNFADPKLAFLRKQIYQIHATAHYYLGKYDDCIEWTKRSLQNICARNPKLEKCFIANAQILIGKVHLKKGDLFEARKLFYQALKLYQEIFGAKHFSIGRAFTFIGLVNLHFKKVQIAERYIQKALSTFKNSDLSAKHVFVGLSCIHMARCNHWKAIHREENQANFLREAQTYYTRAARIFTSLSHSDGYYAAVHRGLGNLFQTHRDWETSLNYYQKEFVCRFNTLEKDSHPNIGKLYNQISQIYYITEQYEEATKNAHLAIYANVDGFKASNDVFTNPKVSFASVDSPHELVKSFANKAKALKAWYEVSGELQYLQLALECLTKVVKLIFRLGQSYFNTGSKLILTEEVRPIQELALECFCLYEEATQGTSNQALNNEIFKVVQKSKATLLLESIIRRNADVAYPKTEVFGKDQPLLPGEDTWQFEDIDERILGGQEFEHLLFLFDNDYPLVRNESIPKLLKYISEEISIEQLQREMKVANTAVISYFVGTHHVYGIIVTNKDFRIEKLSTADDFSMQELSKKVVEFKNILNSDINSFYDLKSRKYEHGIDEIQRDSQTQNSTLALALHPDGIRQATGPRSSREGTTNDRSDLEFDLKQMFNYIHTAHYLYRQLIAPLQLNAATKRVYIIPDGNLSFIPFEALLVSTRYKGNYADLDYVIHRYNISYFFSIATLFYIHRGNSSKVHLSNLSYLGVAANMIRQNYLEHSRNFFFDDEIKKVHHLFRRTGKAYYREEVNKAPILLDFEQYKILHIACHGSDTASLTIIENGKLNQASDMITPKDIQELEIKAELIILSACHSGVGPLAHGEGVIALNRSFIHAGGKNIVYTLFGVPANSSYQLIEKFAQKIIQGVPYSEALWRTRRSFLLEKKKYTPKCWSGYVFMGSHESRIILAKNEAIEDKKNWTKN
ncbi:MAG: CHAT domain-containing tetratricopeptide repeat protein [Bacteroidota bacterium]